MTHLHDFFRKSLSKATFESILSSVSLPLHILSRATCSDPCHLSLYVPSYHWNWRY